MSAPPSAGLLRGREKPVAPELTAEVRVAVVPAARADGVGVVVAGVTGTLVTGVAGVAGVAGVQVVGVAGAA